MIEMQPYSYFLPSCYRRNRNHNNEDEDEDKILSHAPVYSHRFHKNNRSQKKFVDDGRSLTFGKRTQSTFMFTTYHFNDSSGEVEQKQYRSFTTLNYCDHSLYCCHDEICFMFTLHNDSTSAGTGGTSIHISCICFDERGVTQLLRDVLVLRYDHRFSQYSCSQSNDDRKIVVVTGRDLDAYGTDMEMVDNFVDVVSYDKCMGGGKSMKNDGDTHCENGENNQTNGTLKPVRTVYHSHRHTASKKAPLFTMTHERRRNLTECCQVYDVDRIFFSQCGTKLFLVFGKSFLVYSMSLDVFGAVFDLGDDESFHMSRYCFYFHKAYVGNTLLLCQSDGLIYSLQEHELSLHLPPSHNMHLDTVCGWQQQQQQEQQQQLFTFLHVDHFDHVFVYFTIDKDLFVLDYTARCVVAKYTNPSSLYIVDVKTNWSGEEVLVFSEAEDCQQGDEVHMDVLFVPKRTTLREIAKIKVLQNYSKNQIREMLIPSSLKKEMNVF